MLLSMAVLTAAVDRSKLCYVKKGEPEQDTTTTVRKCKGSGEEVVAFRDFKRQCSVNQSKFEWKEGGTAKGPHKDVACDGKVSSVSIKLEHFLTDKQSHQSFPFL